MDLAFEGGGHLQKVGEFHDCQELGAETELLMVPEELHGRSCLGCVAENNLLPPKLGETWIVQGSSVANIFANTTKRLVSVTFFVSQTLLRAFVSWMIWRMRVQVPATLEGAVFTGVLAGDAPEHLHSFEVQGGDASSWNSLFKGCRRTGRSVDHWKSEVGGWFWESSGCNTIYPSNCCRLRGRFKLLPPPFLDSNFRCGGLTPKFWHSGILGFPFMSSFHLSLVI